MSRAVLSAGSNVGDSLGHLRSVVEGFADELVAVSAVYATPPWGGVEQDDFLNVTLVVEGPLSAREWLDRGAGLEQAADRTREVRWGPRTLDVDVISVADAGRVVVDDDPVLTLPHPRAADRAFVLIPWLEIEPDAALWTPEGERPVRELIDALDPAERDAVRAVAWLTGGPAGGGAS
ncbi:2-amino-4-hydroxy-6-hydroxymethyldihydropteridine diphosphokinase [Gordonia westfalica]|uniref:2-amino-4-hydroxy-6-hydroxymethyldihydropteridine diphosphokinase n=1 Tax=Gordonia westfalica TaxID=158898 RepID=A0ABU2GNN6_9ACTN|nr:2-amino-4-hydroxy-6-hydroxymethyldihydropteridine diphosphokinase [Gordonia westfalica]MDS1113068.1 2-amino-4-hydroxy-6-hydroxymethyldihydropteridine diphosphokinase [Gordonia westfalica]